MQAALLDLDLQGVALTEEVETKVRASVESEAHQLRPARRPRPVWRDMVAEFGVDADAMVVEAATTPEPLWRSMLREVGGSPEAMLGVAK